MNKKLTLATTDFDRVLLTSLAAAAIGLAAPAGAQEDDLEEQLFNPVARLVSVPFQFNLYRGEGAHQRDRYELNLQPVVPLAATEHWSFIARAVVPLESVPEVENGGRVKGIGDATLQFFAAPIEAGDFKWGLGPAVLAPTSTNKRFGEGCWALGPTGVGLAEAVDWTLGALATQLWSVGSSDVNRLELQPIVIYNFAGPWSAGYIGTIEADWTVHGRDRWTVPIGLGASRLFRNDADWPISLSFGAGVNAVRPTDAARWFLRLQVTFVFPER